MDYKKRTQLIDALAAMILPNDVMYYLKAAKIDPAMIRWDPMPLNLWTSIIVYAEDNNRLNALVDAVLKKFPENPHLLAFKEDKTQDYTLGPSIKELAWQEPDNTDAVTLEKIIGSVSTLQPIKFLAEGLMKSKAVCRIVISRNGVDEVGTGFLLQKNFLVTNHHVIRDPATASIARIEFNYEEAVGGNAIKAVPFSLIPDEGFETDLPGDWSAVKIQGDANERFGFLELQPVAKVSKKDFVNIIQHPGGRQKQIGLYHNIVTFSNDKIVQYLTDTEPGSSGSPVFNSKWQVVALHHSGGMLREPGMTERFMRNEGIAIGLVVEGLRSKRIIM
ncbi:MAG TPA: trypsin-like peptidase domain-containing protein [Chryseolinea sp.]|nr:trypsin-like peptidase domain-containing protein [Chryseolinea sp.]